jgi:DNA repair and recombination protein RAD54 and RAD54-like protein
MNYEATKRNGKWLDMPVDTLVCDEGHRLKNPKTQEYMATNRIMCTRRICLTGYPLQNNALEYFAMVDFARPGGLKTKGQFDRVYGSKIARGEEIYLRYWSSSDTRSGRPVESR